MRARLAFLGSPAFAVPSLEAAVAVHDVAVVITQPDRPAGRGRAVEPTAVRTAAERLGLRVETYTRAGRAAIDALLRELDLDVLLVVAFGHILKPETLAAARHGAVNVHASLLPRWRGVAPIERAIRAGDTVSGVTLMGLDAGVDTGPMLAQRVVPIDSTDTRVTLAQRLAAEGAAVVRDALGAWIQGDLRAVPQPEHGASYAPRLEKHEAEIDWRAHPLCIWRHVRAFHGWPGAFTAAGGEVIKVHAVQPLDLIASAPPGTIVRADERHGLRVACGGGTIEILELQRPGRRAVSGREWLRGRDVQAGLRLGRPEAAA